MATVEELERRLERLEQRLMEQQRAIVEYTTIANTGAAGDRDAANVAGNPKDRQRAVRRVAPFGLASRPISGMLAAIVKAGAGALNGIIVGVAGEKYAPSNLQEGETALYAITKALIRLWLDGHISIDAQDQNGVVKDVVVQGGSAKVARVGDTVNLGSWSVTTNVSGAVTAINVNGTAIPAVAAELDGTIKTGAANFKA